MRYPPEPAAREGRCMVTGRADGGPCTVIVEELPGRSTVALYPHGVRGLAVLLDREEQRVLGRWLLDRQTTPRRPR